MNKKVKISSSFKQNKSSNKGIFSKKGFLFTISVIFFATTLLLYSQSYLSVTSISEKNIIISAKPFNSLALVDDLAFDVGRILGINVDINSAESTRVNLVGQISSTPDTLDAILGYDSFLNNSFFARVGGSKSIDFSGLLDGESELFFGNELEADYLYSSSIVIYPKQNATMKSIDLNIITSGVHSAYSFSPSVGGQEIQLNLKYYDDGNAFVITSVIDANSLSTLTVTYAGANTVISIGQLIAGGASRNSVIKIVARPSQRITYELGVDYFKFNPYPVFWNIVLRNQQGGVDSNSYLTLMR
ncbi:MAG: hypothetical protein WCW13_03010 [archaeon]